MHIFRGHRNLLHLYFDAGYRAEIGEEEFLKRSRRSKTCCNIFARSSRLASNPFYDPEWDIKFNQFSTPDRQSKYTTIYKYCQYDPVPCRVNASDASCL
jgi:hypothetical protein